MGLNIHYSLKLDYGGANLAREKIKTLHQFALNLPFAEVGELVEFQAEADELNLGEGVTQTKRDRSDPQYWIRANANRGILYDRYHFTVPAQQAIYFRVSPGEGCETAIFGLAIYPETVVQQVDDRLEQIDTDMQGWCWFGLCKTQYASNPNYGGIEHFLKCHFLIIQVLDEAQRLGIVEKVTDDGTYWEQRDLHALTQALEDHNALVAAIVGQLGDVLNRVGQGQAHAPITSYPNFEYLEAKGSIRLKGDESENAETP